MSRRLLWMGTAAVVVLVLAVALGAWLITEKRRDEPLPVDEETAAEALDETAEPRQVTLYYPGEDGRLHGESHEIPAPATPQAAIAEILGLLLVGPREPGLYPPLPSGVQVRQVWLLEDGVAVVDLALPDGESVPGVGSMRERLMLYAVVNTVLMNVPEAERVVPLWNGRQPRTFAGHVDTTRPLGPAPELVASR